MPSLRSRLAAVNRLTSSLRQRIAAVNRRLPSWTWPVVVIIVAVFLGNIMYTSGLATNNPIGFTSGISRAICRLACGRDAIDPNVGFITQPFGHLAAMDLLHGHVPWWNYFEGLGQPLAGEMQSAALFPFTLLFALPAGLLLFHMSLEIIAGLATYALMRHLSVNAPIATAIGVVFALNGTFAWLGNATLNPIAFLPLLLLGIEMIYRGAVYHHVGGWHLVAVAVALSCYAGFPEVAYLDGLLALGWAIVRIFGVARQRRVGAAVDVALGGVVGLLLSLPILIPFLDFMKVANTGSHAVDATIQLPTQALPMFVDPYVYGTIFSNPNTVNAWGSIGGYLLAGSSALALLGLLGARLRALRIFLGVWIVVSSLAMFNFADMHKLFNLIPYVKQTAFSRYAMPSVEMAVVVLAGLGIMDLVSSRLARRLFFATSAVVLGLTIWAMNAAAPYNRGVVLTHRSEIILLGLQSLPFIALGLVIITGSFSRFRVVPVLLAVILAGEAMVTFFVPTAEAPKHITIDYAPIEFLQTHEGQSRFLDFDVLYPNWGSQYGLYALNAIDLPFPQTFANLILSQLNPATSPVRMFFAKGGMGGAIQQEKMLVAHFKAYQAASVKYLLMPNAVIPLPSLKKLGITKVFHDYIATIYEMPSTTPFFSSPTTGCTVSSSSLDHATITCASGGTLVRSELVMAGWHATVNGQAVPITTTGGAYQTVAVPSGTSTVAFTFLPPHEELALAGFLLGLLALFLVPLARWWRRASGNHARGPS